jgi:hypothetical protein
MLRRVVLVRTAVSEDRIPSIIVTRIGGLGTALAVTSNRSQLLLILFLARRFLSPSLWRRYVSPKRRFLQESHGVTYQKTAFFKDSRVNITSKEGVAIHRSAYGWPVSAVSGYLLFKDFCETMAEEPVPQLKFYEEVSTQLKGLLTLRPWCIILI